MWCAASRRWPHSPWWCSPAPAFTRPCCTFQTRKLLLATPYGRALLVKLVMLSLLLGVGASNFLLRGRGPFGRLVVVELLLALGLFVATGFLTSLPPASST